MRYLLHHAVREAADRDPSHIAARFAGTSLTYGELEAASNQLGHALRDAGVRRGDRVGIYSNKSLALPTAIYGIQKAGAAYVPLDPTAPRARLDKIVRDCGLRHVITEEKLRSTAAELAAADNPLQWLLGIAPGDDVRGRCITWSDVDAASNAPPDVGGVEQDLAYVLYTSGSTAEPKGIMHTHRSALSFANVAAATYGFHAGDRISNHAPLQFDLSTLDYFATGQVGATIVIIPEPYTRVPASLSTLMADESLTVLYAVPLAMIQLTLRGALDQRDLSALRWVLFGGEPFPTKHLREMMRLLPHAQFSNVYGPTEVNGCTYHVVPPLAAGDDAPIPIGGLYDNAEALVVDTDDQPVSIGTPGELLIRSGTRMLGYWGRPDLTDAATYRRSGPGGEDDLFHRTGDLVTERPDGAFEFLGRKDRQVKVRGHRIELDEIEVALLAHGAVEEAAAFTIPDDAGSQQIIATLLLSGGADTVPDTLGAHLRDHLPPYAVPSAIEVLPAFPRSTNGKIDRRALQERAATGGKA